MRSIDMMIDHLSSKKNPEVSCFSSSSSSPRIKSHSCLCLSLNISISCVVLPPKLITSVFYFVRHCHRVFPNLLPSHCIFLNIKSPPFFFFFHPQTAPYTHRFSPLCVSQLRHSHHTLLTMSVWDFSLAAHAPRAHH